MPLLRLATIIAWSSLVALLACSTGDRTAPAFDAERAYQHLVSQVAFGPRVPGSEAAAQCRDYFYRFFDTLGLVIDSQVFMYRDPYSGDTIRMVNVIARVDGGEADNHILLMAHYDCRPRTDYASDTALRDEPIDGANDGASGTAVLLELARLCAQSAPPTNVDLVLVDGEDWGKAGDHENYMLGSREFVRRGVHGRYRFGIVVDLVGDRDQQIYREGYSEKFYKCINDMIWSTAARLGIPTFIDSVKHTVQDDHLSLMSAGIPAANIIDFDYRYWHTEFDTPDKCSPEALANVGRVVTEITYKPSLWPKL